MISDEYYYSSDSYSEKKPNQSSLSKRLFPIPPKDLIQKTNDINSPPIIKRRPIPGISKAKNPAKTTQKQASVPSILPSSVHKKKIIMPIDSESSSYYDYEYESENEDLPIPSTISQIKESAKKMLAQHNDLAIKRQSSNVVKSFPTKQQIQQPVITNFEDDELIEDDQINECRDFFVYEPEYIETNEEPDFKISEQTINLMKLIQCNSHSNNENTDKSNTLEICSKEKLSFKIICTKSQFSNYTFQFFSNNQCLINAHSSNKPKSIIFTVPEHFDKEDIIIGTMFISKNKRQFNLNCNGSEVMSVDISTIKEPVFCDNYFNINLKNPNTNEIEMTLKTLLSQHNSDRKYTKKSIKKIVLVSNDENLISIKRVKEDQLKIKANSFINDDLKIFAIGVASWISTH